MPEVRETVRFLPKVLYDAERAICGDGALGKGVDEDSLDRFEEHLLRHLIFVQKIIHHLL
jgi:hypothetical protein